MVLVGGLVGLVDGFSPAAARAQASRAASVEPSRDNTGAGALVQKQRLLGRLLADLRRKVAAQPNSGRVEHLQEVEELNAQAHMADTNGQPALAMELTDQALVKATHLARALRPPGPDRERLRARYADRIEAVAQFRTALLEAAARKGLDPATLRLGELDNLTQEAAEQAAEGDLTHAIVALEAAYGIVSASLAAVRAHDTEVHRLQFSSPGEEYRYERSRYQSYEALVRMVLAERQWDVELTERMQAELTAATVLHREADEMAGDRSVADAIKTQEAAVGHLIIALRHAGLYVPR